MAKGQGGLNEKKFEKREALLEAALSEFSEKSFEEASLNTILRNAGISKGVFYYHFSDKRTLYLFLLDEANRAKWEFICARLPDSGAEAEGETIFDLIRRQGRLGAEFALQHPRYHKLSRMLRKEKGRPIYRTVEQHFGADTERQLAGMIDRALEQGDFRRPYPREFLQRLFSVLLSGFDEVFGAEEQETPEQVLRNLDGFMDVLQFGLGKDKNGGE